MRKLWFIPCLLFMLAVFFVPALAEESGDYKYSVENDEATITLYLGEDERVDIPSTLGGYPVTAIGYRSFMRCESLTEVNIPSTVRLIGSDAFAYCANLREISIPEGVEEIGSEAFRSTGIETIVIPASASVLSEDILKACISLKNIIVASGNENYRSIDGVWFDKAGTRLIAYPSGSERTEYTFPDSVESLTANAFYLCANLSKITIPDRIRNIPNGSFVGCEKLKTAGPAGSGCNIEYEWTEEIPAYAFGNCSTLEEVSFPSTMTRIGESAFTYTGLLELTVPGNIRTIDEFAFSFCDSLKTAKLLPGVETLGEGTFYSSNGLETITIPASVYEIGYRAFEYYFNGTSSNYYNLDVTMYVQPDSYAHNYAINKGFSYIAAPKIIGEPEDISVNEEETAAFTVMAEGEDLSYQWYYKAADASEWTKVSATSGKTARYSLKTAYRHNGYTYRCCISNVAGDAYSNEATLTVIAHKPVITAQPGDVMVSEGETASFKVTASGSGLSYQWYYKKPGSTSWTKVSKKGTSATYKLTTEARHDGYQYRCVIQNNGGKVTSAAGTLTVCSVPAISSQPESVTVYEGSTVSFSVLATGGNLRYQWYYKKPGSTSWTAVKTNGASADYSLTAELRHDGYLYRVKVSNSLGKVYSETVSLTVKEVTKPSITKQPKSVGALTGDTVKFTVTASGGGLTYQWYYKKPDSSTWTAVKKNGNSASYSITAEDRLDGYKYRCKVTNSKGSVYSSTATLTMVTYPCIIKYCYSYSVPLGYRAEFKVEATGGDLHYQWYYMKPGSDTWTKVSINGTDAVYTFVPELRHNGYCYRCVISNAAGSVTTGEMYLEVY